MTGAPEVATDADSLDFVSTGTYAFLHDVNSVKYLYSSDCQKLYLATSTFNNNGLGIILPKDAPYKDAIDTMWAQALSYVYLGVLVNNFTPNTHLN